MRTIVVAILCLFLFSCKKTNPCFEKAGVKNCTELFEQIQVNLHDPLKSKELRDCYDQHCQ